MKKLMILTLLSISLSGFAQKIKLIEGDLKPLKGQTSIDIELTYDNLRVGKFEKEKDYIEQKKADYNTKEAGKGDKWAAAWEDDKVARYKPRFTEMFTESMKMTKKAESTYTIIFNTTFIEPGFNVGVMRKNAYINGDAIIVEINS